MKFKDITSAKQKLVEVILVEYIAVLTYDNNVQEKNIKMAFKIEQYIKENFDIKEMKDLLNHDIPAVQLWAAKLLLPYYEEISLKVLDEISKKNIPHSSSNARIIFCEWKKEPITFPY